MVKRILLPTTKSPIMPKKKNIIAVPILRTRELIKVFPSLGFIDMRRMTLANIPRFAATEKKSAYSVILA